MAVYQGAEAQGHTSLCAERKTHARTSGNLGIFTGNVALIQQQQVLPYPPLDRDPSTCAQNGSSHHITEALPAIVVDSVATALVDISFGGRGTGA